MEHVQAFEAWLDQDWPLWRNDPGNPNVARLRRAWNAANRSVETKPEGFISEGALKVLRDPNWGGANIKRTQHDEHQIPLYTASQQRLDATKLAKQIMAIMGPTPAPCCDGCNAEWNMVLDLVRPLAQGGGV